MNVAGVSQNRYTDAAADQAGLGMSALVLMVLEHFQTRPSSLDMQIENGQALCLELKGVHIVSMNTLMTQAYLQPLQPPHGYDNQLSLITWLSIQREDSRGWSYYLFSVTTQMVSQTDRLMGIHVFIAGKQIMTP